MKALALLVLLASSHPKEPDQWVAEIDAVKDPVWDVAKAAEPSYRQVFVEEFAQSASKRAELILRFYGEHPDDERMRALMNRRWREMQAYEHPPAAKRVAAALADLDAFLRGKTSDELKGDALYWRSHYASWGAYPDVKQMVANVEPFLSAYPTDRRGIDLLALAADNARERGERIGVLKTLTQRFKGFPEANRYAGAVRRLESIGKPVDVSFTDAISGKKVDVKDLRGKVVVMDFWATWCPPCIAEMPKLKELQAKYQDKLQIIGVSVDASEQEGGLKAMKAFVEKNGLPLPQLYGGNGMDSEIAVHWGITAVPAKLILDKEGRLVDSDGVWDLEKLLTELID